MLDAQGRPMAAVQPKKETSNGEHREISDG
jgi:hypothetical protein